MNLTEALSKARPYKLVDGHQRLAWAWADSDAKAPDRMAWWAVSRRAGDFQQPTVYRFGDEGSMDKYTMLEKAPEGLVWTPLGRRRK